MRLTRPWPARAALLGMLSGLLAGCGAFVFLEVLDLVTNTRVDHGWLLWLLPVTGAAWGAVQWQSRRHAEFTRALGGTNAVIAEARDPQHGVSRWQAPIVLLGTWAAHLTGASVGREGVGLQVSASLSEHMARLFRLDRSDRRTLVVAAIAGGFASVFAVPWAGAIFALEVSGRPRVRPTRLVAAVTAAFTGNWVVHRLGHQHTVWPRVDAESDLGTAVRMVVLGMCLAGAAWVFVTGVDALKALADRFGTHPVLRPTLGGSATVLLAMLWGHDYLGLSLPVLDAALTATAASFMIPALKAVFTIVALGTGFPGGEVTPLFVIGASLGAALAGPLGLAPPLAAATAMVGLFAAASGTPVACTVMAIELFGPAVGGYVLVACVVAATLNRGRRLYPADGSPQRVGRTRTGN